jgi:predicted RNase H-like nuclease (RuvC/YqgF family)
VSRTRKGSKGPGWEPWSNRQEKAEQKADYREEDEVSFALENQVAELSSENTSLKERVAQLERELAEVNALSRERLGPAGWKMVREVGELRKDRDALREVLDFYAQGNEWDYGVKAREALSPRSGDGAEESKT